MAPHVALFLLLEAMRGGDIDKRKATRSGKAAATLRAAEESDRKRCGVLPEKLEKEWLTTDELGRWLGIGRTKTYELISRNEIPSYMLGGRIRRIRRQDVEAWLERNKFDPGNPS